MTHLNSGTVIDRKSEIIELTSEYDALHNGYDCIELRPNDNGDLEPHGNESSVTTLDLIGGEII